jgi:excisionase family DNA binding protein
MQMSRKLAIEGIFFTVEEAAQALGLAVDSVRRYCNATKPKINAKKAGRDWLIPKSEIERYRRERNAVGRPTQASK